MNQDLKLVCGLVLLIVVCFLLLVNIFLLWNVHDKLRDNASLLSRIERLEAEVDLAKAYADKAYSLAMSNETPTPTEGDR